MHCLRAISILLTAAMCGLAAAAAGQGLPQRLVIYVDEDSPDVRVFLDKVRRAYLRTPAAARHALQLELESVDVASKHDLRAALGAVLERRPAAIIASNSNVAMVAKSLTRSVPIVFASHQDPVAMGLVESLARPGANLTGFTYFVPTDGKRLELLRELAPKARKLGIIVDRWWLDESGGAATVALARSSLGFEVTLFAAESEAEFQKALGSPAAHAMDAWYVPYTRLAYERPSLVVDGVRATRRAAAYATTRFVEEGGLVSYQQVFSLETTITLLATTVGLVLDGVPPAEIPIERPKSFELAVNSDAARELGIKVPAALLKRADRVITRRGAPAPSR